jgi:hypothetical protein
MLHLQTFSTLLMTGVGQTESLDTVASNDPTLPDRDGVDNDG